MFDRRDFLRTAGGVLGGGFLVGSASAQTSEVENYELVGEAPVPGINELVTQGDWAYAASQGSITTIDVNNPEFPTVGGRAEGQNNEDTPDVTVAGDVAVLTHQGVSGVSLFDVSDPLNPTFESFYRANDGIHNAYAKRSPDGRTYAYLCVSDSVNEQGFSGARMVVVDVTDPAKPETLEGEDTSYVDATDVPDDERGTGGAWMLNDARPEMTNGRINPIHDLYVEEDDSGNELAYLCFWEAGIVVVDVTVKRRPVAVGHFGAVPYADYTFTNQAERLQLYLWDEKSNAHYCQPTPEQNFALVGAETFPGPDVPPGGEAVEPAGDHGGIRVFDVEAIEPVAEGGAAIYPDADDVASDPRDIATDPIGPDAPVQNPDPDIGNPDNRADLVAYLPAPEGPDDAAVTAHNFDLTDRMLFASWYQGGVRAYDLATLYRGGDYEVPSRNPRKPIEVGVFAPDGMAFWTAVDVDYEENPDAVYTLGSDIGKGAVSLKLNRGPGGLF